MDATAQPTHVCIALASKISADLLSREFTDKSPIPIVCTSVSKNDALKELTRTPHQIFLTNLDLDGTKHSGLQLLTNALDINRNLRCIVLANSARRDDVIASFRAGARGYMIENETSIEMLLKAIHCVSGGQVWASSELLNYLVDEFTLHNQRQRVSTLLSRLLTNRERQVVDLITVGKSNKEIAASLHVSEHTIKNHLVNIYAKLRVTSRSEAIFKIFEHFSHYEEDRKRPM